MKQQPIPPNRIIQFLVIAIVLLAFFAGYYHALYQTEVRKNHQIEHNKLDILQSENP